MSLLEAFLLDPAPYETWVAYRLDGIKGSGTLNDPWNGAPTYAASISVTQLTNTARVATATTASNHGYNDGDFLTISGADKPQYNGTFAIHLLSASQFSYYMSADPGASATGTIKAAKVTAFRFDDLLNSFPANTRVHLGPTPSGSPFLTQGYADGVTGGAQPKAGMKITGSGTDVTVVQLITPLSLASSTHYFAFGHSLVSGGAANALDGFELSDLTIDCNFNPPSGGATRACGGLRVMGNHARVTRVKAINWGNKVSGKPGFALAMITADPDTNALMNDVGIDSCIAIQPSVDTTEEVLVLHAGGKDFDATSVEAFGKGAYIRNCFVEGDAGGGLGTGSDYRSKLRALSMNSCWGGIIEGNQIQNIWIGGPYLSRWSAREITVRNNLYRNVVYGPYLNLQTLGSSISLTSINTVATTPVVIAEAQSATAHPLTVGDRVYVTGATKAQYNGVFVVAAVTVPDKFRYQMASDPGANQGSGASMQKVLGAEKVVIEGNAIQLATFQSGAAATPVAIKFDASANGSQGLGYTYGDVMLRTNRILYVDGDPAVTNIGYGTDVKGARNLVVRENVVEVIPTPSIKNGSSGAVKYFDNNTPGGVLIRGWNQDTSKKYDELQTEVEDALLLGML